MLSHYFVHGSQQTFSFWARFHEKEELLRVKCLLCVALLVSEQCEQAQATSAEQLEHHKALGLLALPWMSSAGKCLFPPSVLSLLPPLPQKPWDHMPPSTVSWMGISVSVTISVQQSVCVMHLPSVKRIWHSHQPRYSLCIPANHQLVITTTHHRTVHCTGRGRQG